MRRGGRILLVAGEASGDQLGARLAEALLRARPDLRLVGVGGPAMRAAGVETSVDISELGVMGFAEIAGALRRILGIHARLRRELRHDAPDLFVPIDFPDFNLPLCRTASRAGVPVFYYVSPQVWAWRRRRMRTLARHVRRVLVLFPFEEALYRGRGIDARFVGHPLAESIAPSLSRGEVRRRLGIDEDTPLLALLPGSRRHEVEAMLPSMLDAASRLGGRVAGVVAEAPSLPPGFLDDALGAGGRGVARLRGDAHSLLAAADVALVTSGTATLEAALLGCPMVVAYRLSRFSHAIARLLVKVPFIAMPNLLLGRRLVAELVQDEAEPARMAAELARLLDDAGEVRRMREGFDEIRRMLVLPGAADRAAALALEVAG